MEQIINRARQLDELKRLIEFSPVVAILGPRQSGKTTLARMIEADHYR